MLVLIAYEPVTAQASHRPVGPLVASLGNEPTTQQLDSFWQQVAERGTPLIASSPRGDDWRLVTFLWRGDEQTENVLVSGVGGFDDFDGNTMQRVAESDVLYRTQGVAEEVAVGPGFERKTVCGLPTESSRQSRWTTADSRSMVE